MGYDLFTKTDAINRANALVANQTTQSPIPALTFVYGERLAANIKPVRVNNGTPGYDPAYENVIQPFTLKVGLGIPGGVPTSGTFTLTFEGQTTSALPFNATPEQVQTALQALSSIGTGNVNVKGLFPNYEIQFIGALAAAPQALITSNDQLLFPDSTANIVRKYTGSEVQNEIQLLRLTLDAVSLQSEWDDVTEGEDEAMKRIGFSGTLDFGTPGIAALFGRNQPSIKATLDIVIIAPGNVPKWLAQVPLTLLNRIVNPESPGYFPPKNYASGTANIPEGADVGTVTGLNLGTVPPREVRLTVSRPAGSLVIFACPDSDSISTDGFSYALSGITDSPNYKLHYDLHF